MYMNFALFLPVPRDKSSGEKSLQQIKTWEQDQLISNRCFHIHVIMYLRNGYMWPFTLLTRTLHFNVETLIYLSTRTSKIKRIFQENQDPHLLLEALHKIKLVPGFIFTFTLNHNHRTNHTADHANGLWETGEQTLV